MSLHQYFKEIKNKFSSGYSGEHAYRGEFATMLKNLIDEMHRNQNIEIINEPSNVADCGSPDFVITSDNLPISFIETKDIGENLDASKHQEQFNRYKNVLENLIITNYLDFQYFRHGELVNEVQIG